MFDAPARRIVVGAGEGRRRPCNVRVHLDRESPVLSISPPKKRTKAVVAAGATASPAGGCMDRSGNGDVVRTGHGVHYAEGHLGTLSLLRVLFARITGYVLYSAWRNAHNRGLVAVQFLWYYWSWPHSTESRVAAVNMYVSGRILYLIFIDSRVRSF